MAPRYSSYYTSDEREGPFERGFEGAYVKPAVDPSDAVAVAQYPAAAYPSYDGLVSSLEPGYQKMIQGQLRTLDQQGLAAAQKFENLTFNDKFDNEEDQIGQAIGKTLLALLPIAGGYILGGDRLAAAGAGAGLGGLKTFEDQVAQEEKMGEKKKALVAKQYAAEMEALAKEKELVVQEGLRQQKRGESMTDKMAYAQWKKERGLDLGSALGGVSNALEALATKKAIPEVTTKFVEESDKIDSALNTISSAVDAMDRYMEKNPSAKTENNLEAGFRNYITEALPSAEFAQMESALNLGQLEILNETVRGTPSDRDQKKMDNALANWGTLPLPAKREVWAMLGKALVQKKTDLRSRMERALSDPEGWRRPSSIEERATVKFGTDTVNVDPSDPSSPDYNPFR